MIAHLRLRPGLRVAMGHLTKAFARAAQAHGSTRMAGAQQRAQASLAARDMSEPKLPPFAHEPAAYTGPSKQEVIDLRKRHLNPGEQGLHLGQAGKSRGHSLGHNNRHLTVPRSHHGMVQEPSHDYRRQDAVSV